MSRKDQKQDLKSFGFCCRNNKRDTVGGGVIIKCECCHLVCDSSNTAEAHKNTSHCTKHSVHPPLSSTKIQLLLVCLPVKSASDWNMTLIKRLTLTSDTEKERVLSVHRAFIQIWIILFVSKYDFKRSSHEYQNLLYRFS